MRQATDRKTSPSTVSDRPTGAKSNIANGLPIVSWRTSLTIMLVEVPTSVDSPAISEMNDIGISSADTELPSCRPTLIAVGIRIVSAPTFLVTIDNRAVAPVMAGTCVVSVVSFLSPGASVASTTPDRAIPALTTSAAAMMTTTSLVKPLNASFTGTMPIAIATHSATSDTVSYRNRPQAKVAMVKPMSEKERICGCGQADGLANASPRSIRSWWVCASGDAAFCVLPRWREPRNAGTACMPLDPRRRGVRQSYCFAIAAD